MEQINFPVDYPPNLLEGMYKLQWGLIKHYQGIEGLPPAPINLESKKGQALIKDFLARAVEEFSEAHEIYREIYTRVSSNNGDNLEELIVGFNEEIADALHFVLETFIFCDITEATLDNYYRQLFEQIGIKGKPGNPLQSSIDYAHYYLNSEMNTSIKSNAFYTVPLFTIDPAMKDWAGQRTSLSMVTTQAQLLWDITHQFMMAANCLKNRPWYKTDQETNTNMFYEFMCRGWLALMNLLVWEGMTEESIYDVYYNKNIINQERINSKR